MASGESPSSLNLSGPGGNPNGTSTNVEMKSVSMFDLRTTKKPEFPHAKKMSFTLHHSRDYLADGFPKFQIGYIDKLIRAAKMGDVDRVMDIVAKLGTDGIANVINEHDGKNNGAIHYAALNNDVNVVKLLLDMGADINDPGEGGKHPLHFSVLANKRDKQNTSNMAYMAESNASGSAFSEIELSEVRDSELTVSQELFSDDVGHHGRSGVRKRFPLNFAPFRSGKPKRNEIQPESLIEPPSLPNVQEVPEDAADDVPLDMLLAEHENSTVHVLLSRGADVNARDAKGRTAIHLSALQGNVAVQNILLSVPKADINMQDRRGSSPLSLACQAMNTEGALLLINKGADETLSDANGDTPLHVAIRQSDNALVMALLAIGNSKGQMKELMMSVNSLGATPLYEAVKCGNLDLFQLCLNHVSGNDHAADEAWVEDMINFAGDYEDTLLHVAASQGHFDIAETLVNRGALVNCVNQDAQTPLHLACAHNYEEIALCLIEHGTDPNAEDNAGLNPLQMAANHCGFETLITLLQTMSSLTEGHCAEATEIVRWAARRNKSETLRKILDYEFQFHELSDEEIMDFIMDAVQQKHMETVMVLIRWKRAVVDHKDALGNTALHYAAKKGFHNIASELIKWKACVNARNSEEEFEQAPLHYAAAHGWPRTARILLEAGADIDRRDGLMRTPLHHACKKGEMSMVELLLCGKGAGEVTQLADIIMCDVNEHSCLDHAIDNGHENVAQLILGHDRWRDVLSLSSPDDETAYRTTPMRKLIRFMPSVAKMVLDRCITVTGGKSITDSNICVDFYFELIEDAFSSWMKTPDSKDDLPSNNNILHTTNGSVKGFVNRLYQRVTTHVPDDEEDQFDDNNHLKRTATPYITDSTERSENHPLQIMATSQRVDLLDHPVVSLYLQHKWNLVGRYIFLTSFLLYIVFVGLLTGYIVFVPPNYYVRTVNHTGPNNATVVWFADGQYRWVESISDSALVFFDVLGPHLILIFAMLNICREIAQMFLQKLAYFKTPSNFFELAMYLAAILFALPFSDVEYIKGGYIKRPWQWPTGAMAGFMAWINLLLFLRGNSKLGIYVIMFIDIFKTFLRFGLILFLFIFAFGLAFYALLMNQNPFHTLGDSMMKTFVMMIGELDYADIFFGQDYLGTSNTLAQDGEAAYFMNTNFYNNFTQAFFAIFLVVMSILMMNMLVGLAVDDIQAIQQKANLHRLTMHVDNVIEVQSKFPTWIWRSSVIRSKKFNMNKKSFKLWFKRLLHGGSRKVRRAVEIHHSLEDPMLVEESAFDDMYEKLRQRMKEVNRKLEVTSAELLDGAKKRDDQLDQIRNTQKGLRDRTDIVHRAQERLEDRVELMHKKMDAMLKRLKIKQKKVEGL